MGNTPGKEARVFPAGGLNSTPSASSGESMSTSTFAREYLTNYENTHGHHHHHHGSDHAVSKRKREKEAEKLKYKTKQIMNLVVNYDENVDGGYLAPYGNYKYNLDYMTNIVRDLIIRRKLSPFFTPLQDFDEKWTDAELLTFLKANLKLHEDIEPGDLSDDYEDPNEHKLHPSANSVKRREGKLLKQKLKEKAAEYQRRENMRFLKDLKAAETNPKKYPNIPSDDLLLRLYRDSEECPICFLYYPKLLNTTRCCVQSICTECFVQMKRLEPHFPHDENSGENSTGTENKSSEDLISEPVKCPFCAVDNFGVTYAPARDFKTGIEGSCKPGEFRFAYKTIEEEGIGEEDSVTQESHETNDASSADVLTEIDLADPFSVKKQKLESKKKQQHRRNTSSVSNNTQAASEPRKRRESLPPGAPSVVTIDSIRPDWEQKLLVARTELARRSAAATALHATSLLRNDESSRLYSSGGNRNHASGNYNRQEHLEEMLIEEAMRLSLLDEEERKMRELMKRNA